MNKGEGLVSGKAGAALVDGDRIVTLDKSSAKIVFADGCTVTLEENNIFVINAELGCKALPVASTGAARRRRNERHHGRPDRCRRAWPRPRPWRRRRRWSSSTDDRPISAQ